MRGWSRSATARAATRPTGRSSRSASTGCWSPEPSRPFRQPAPRRLPRGRLASRSGHGLGDGRALHEILFTRATFAVSPGGARRPPASSSRGRWMRSRRGWRTCGRERRSGSSTTAPAPGTATIELLKACRERRLEERLANAGRQLRGPPRRPALELVRAGPRAAARLRLDPLPLPARPGGGFRPLPDVTGGEQMDAVMASMVFHLIPPPALERLGAELAGVLGPGAPLPGAPPTSAPRGRGRCSCTTRTGPSASAGWSCSAASGKRPPAALSEAVRRALERSIARRCGKPRRGLTGASSPVRSPPT